MRSLLDGVALALAGFIVETVHHKHVGVDVSDRHLASKRTAHTRLQRAVPCVVQPLVGRRSPRRDDAKLLEPCDVKLLTHRDWTGTLPRCLTDGHSQQEVRYLLPRSHSRVRSGVSAAGRPYMCDDPRKMQCHSPSVCSVRRSTSTTAGGEGQGSRMTSASFSTHSQSTSPAFIFRCTPVMDTLSRRAASGSVRDGGGSGCTNGPRRR
jgi:hypothetical protein